MKKLIKIEDTYEVEIEDADNMTEEELQKTASEVIKVIKRKETKDSNLVVEEQESPEAKLYHEDGSEVKKGDKVVSFRGENAIVTGWEAPFHEGKSGRVYVKWEGKEDEMGYYPQVFNLSWKGLSWQKQIDDFKNAFYKSKGEQIARVLASALKGECGPFGGENPRLVGNKLGLTSQMPTEWFIFRDDGSVEFENLEELLDKEAEFWGIETEEDKVAIIAENKHFNSVKDLLNSDLSWFEYLDKDEILSDVETILKKEVEDAQVPPFIVIGWDINDKPQEIYGCSSEEKAEELARKLNQEQNSEYGEDNPDTYEYSAERNDGSVVKVYKGAIEDAKVEDIPVHAPEEEVNITYTEKLKGGKNALTYGMIETAFKNRAEDEGKTFKAYVDVAIESLKDDIANAKYIVSGEMKETRKLLLEDYIKIEHLVEKAGLQDKLAEMKPLIDELSEKLDLNYWKQPKFKKAAQKQASRELRNKHRWDSKISKTLKPVFLCTKSDLTASYNDAKQGKLPEVFEGNLEKVHKDMAADYDRIMQGRDTYVEDPRISRTLPEIVDLYETALRYADDLEYSDYAREFALMLETIKKGWGLAGE